MLARALLRQNSGQAAGHLETASRVS